jgi:hypothetical protein
VLQSVLIVHPAPSVAADLEKALSPDAHQGPFRFKCNSVVVSSFEAARAVLQTRPPALLVTPVALGEHNGLHLVYLARTVAEHTRSVVHTLRPDAGIGREIRAAGAFYELESRLMAGLPAYLTSTLPPAERRAHPGYDRRGAPRPGRGRRLIDQYAAAS